MWYRFQKSMQVLRDNGLFRQVRRHGGLLILLVALLMGTGLGRAVAQTGTEFWFDVSEVNRYHSFNQASGMSVFLYVTALDKNANVSISLPAEPGFNELSFEVPANSSRRIQLTDGENWTGGSGMRDVFPATPNYADINKPMTLFFAPGSRDGRNGQVSKAPLDYRPKSIENVLAWSESDMTAARPYMNRTNKGVRLSADNKVMVYLVYDGSPNLGMTIFKGENAKGTHFFVPMQTDITSSAGYDSDKDNNYSSINITATEDNTKIKVIVPREVWIANPENASPNQYARRNGTDRGEIYRGEPVPGEPGKWFFYIWLNRGQSSIIPPYGRQSRKNNGNRVYDNYQVETRNSEIRLEGTEIQVMSDEGSGGDIVVTTRDDLVSAPNPDYVIDQMVPVDYAGRYFAILQGRLGNQGNEFIYVVGTQDGTNITLKGSSGTTLTGTVDRGRQKGFQIGLYKQDFAFSIETDKPVMLFHMSGDEMGRASQRDGAVIPALPEDNTTCIGSKTVAFSRAKKYGPYSTSVKYIFFLNLVAWYDQASIDKGDRWGTSIGHFVLQKSYRNPENPSDPKNTNGFVDVQPTDDEYKFQEFINELSNWKDFKVDPNTPLSRWKWLRANTDDLGANFSASPYVAYQLVNKANVFQLGVLNGYGSGLDALYGYFSDFAKVSLNVAVTDSQGNAHQGSSIGMCRGGSTELKTNLGQDDFISWSPATYLDYTDRPTVTASEVMEGLRYTVTVHGYCNMAVSQSVKLDVGPRIPLELVGAPSRCGSGDVSVEALGLSSATTLTWDVSVPSDPSVAPEVRRQTLASLGLSDPDRHTESFTLSHPGGPGAVEYEVLVRANNGQCASSARRQVRVYPAVRKPAITVTPQHGGPALSAYCGPVSLSLSASPGVGGNYSPHEQLRWSLLPGVSARGAQASVTYGNTSSSLQTYTPWVYVEHDESHCRDSARAIVSVLPEVRGRIVLREASFCDGARVGAQAVLSGVGRAGGYSWSYEAYQPGSSTLSGLSTEVAQKSSSLSVSLPSLRGDGPTRYQLRLRAYARHGSTTCEATDRADVTVHPGALADAAISVEYESVGGDGCGPYRVRGTLSGLSGLSRYSWFVVRGPGDRHGQALAQGAFPSTSPATESLSVSLVPQTDSRDYKEVGGYLYFRGEGSGGCLVERWARFEVSPPLTLTLDLGGASEEGLCPDAEGRAELVARATGARPTGTRLTWAVNGQAVNDRALLIGDTVLRAPLLNTSETARLSVPILVRATRDERLGGQTFTCAREARGVARVNPRVNPRITSIADSASGLTISRDEPLCAPLTLSLQGVGAATLRWRLARTDPSGDQVYAARVSGTDPRARAHYRLENPTGSTQRLRVELVGVSEYGCASAPVAREFARVEPALRPSFTYEVLDACPPVRVRLREQSSPSGPGLERDWHGYGGGSADLTDPGAPVVTFREPGRKTLRLTLSGFGCAREAAPQVLEVPAPLEARIQPLTASETRVCAPATLTFSSASRGFDQLVWDFGDGSGPVTARTGAPATHTFTNSTGAPLRRTVTLWARRAGSACEQTAAARARVDVMVYPSPEAISSLEVLGAGCAPVRARLTNASRQADAFEWAFRSSVLGQVTPPVRSGTLADQQVSLVNQTLDETVRYAVTLTARKRWPGGPECSATASLGEVSVPPAITATLSPPDPAICSGEAAPLTLTMRGGADLVASWDFGDGSDRAVSLGPGAHARSHLYRNATASDQRFPVSVTVRQSATPGQCAVTVQAPVRVHPGVRPRLLAEVVGSRCARPMRVRLSNAGSQGSEAPSGVSSSAQWWFDYGPSRGEGSQDLEEGSLDGHDAERGFSADPARPNAPRRYRVRLRAAQTHAISGLTCVGIVEDTLTVPPVPTARIAALPASGCAPLTVALDGRASTGGEALTHQWSLGDGATATGAQPTHVYQANAASGAADAQTLTVSLRVRSEYGCLSAPASETVTLYPSVPARFTAEHAPEMCTPYALTLTNAAPRAGVRYRWEVAGPSNQQRQESVYQAGDDPRWQTRLANTGQRAETATVRLYAETEAGGCRSVSAPQTFTVPPQLRARFSMSETAGCSPLTVALTNTSQGAAAVRWTFGEEQGAAAPTSEAPNPAPLVLENPSNQLDRPYTVRLTASNGHGCQASQAQTLTIYPQVSAEFTLDRPAGCSPLTVTPAVAEPSPAYSYRWQLAAGKPDAHTERPGPQTYTNPYAGSPDYFRQTLALTAWLTAHPECSAQARQQVTVHPRVLAGFTLAKAQGCSPLTVAPTNTTRHHAGEAMRYSWDLVEQDAAGAPMGPYQPRASAQSPVLTLPPNETRTQDRKFRLRLRAISASGCEDQAEQTLTVLPLPSAGFRFAGDEHIGCSPLQVRLISEAQGKGLTLTYQMGDGSPDQQSAGGPISHTYLNPGAQDRPVQIVQTVVSADGCPPATATQTVLVHPQVRASFTLGRERGCAPFAPTITNTSENASSYRWWLGYAPAPAESELISTKVSPAHAFANPSVRDLPKVIRLRARSIYGCEDELARTVHVLATPVAKFAVDREVMLFPDAELALSNQTAPADPGWSYTWSFGETREDGRQVTSRAQQPQPHRYASWGPKDQGFVYRIRLEVSTGKCASFAEREVVVRAPQPQILVTPSREQGCPPFPVRFHQQSRYMSAYRWEFDDGTISELPSPEHLFRSAGAHRVRLTLTGDGGTAQRDFVILAHELPKVDFAIDPPSQRMPEATVRGLNMSQFGSQFWWDFGDGAKSREAVPVHTYQEPGKYSVTLIAESPQGCRDTLTRDEAVEIRGDGSMRFPTAFRPSLEGPNGGLYPERDLAPTVFHPFILGSVQEYRMVVYNRWGEQLFESDDPQRGWDGYRAQELQPMGVYTYKVSGLYADGSEFHYTGNVTLLR